MVSWCTGPQPLHYTENSRTSSATPTTHLVISHLHAQCLFELWHNRLIHCCKQTMHKAHTHITGVPKLKGNPFFHDASCLHTKPKWCSPSPSQPAHASDILPPTLYITELSDELDYLDLISPPTEFPNLQNCQMFFMDLVLLMEKCFKTSMVAS